jgi:hypothetical protein
LNLKLSRGALLTRLFLGRELELNNTRQMVLSSKLFKFTLQFATVASDNKQKLLSREKSSSAPEEIQISSNQFRLWSFGERFESLPLELSLA